MTANEEEDSWEPAVGANKIGLNDIISRPIIELGEVGELNKLRSVLGDEGIGL